jgi:6-phosphogluconolactonase
MMGATFVYVSCAEDGEIASYALEPAGTLAAIARVKVAKGVMPMAVSPDRRFLYVVSRPLPYAIHVLSIDRDTGALTPSSTSPLPESLPYISFDRSGRFLLGASYHKNLITVTAVGVDGRVAPAPLQTIPVGRNAHSIRVDASNRFVFVPTLGSDAVFLFRFDAAAGALVANTPPLLLTPSGAGPRHFDLSPDNRFLYVLCEMSGAILTFALDAETGLLTDAGSVSGLAPDCALVPGVPRGGPQSGPTRDLTRDIWAADIHLTPNGKFLYASERTESTLNAFAVDASTGKLEYRSTRATEPQPRGFAIDPSGRFLVATGERSDSISVYSIDDASGALERIGRNPTGKGSNWVEIVHFDAQPK